MSDAIISRLMKNHRKSSEYLKESMSLFEADADEEYAELNSEDETEETEDTAEESTEDVPEEGSEDVETEGEYDDSTAPEQGSPSSSAPSPDFSDEEEVPEEEEPVEEETEDEEKPEEYENPLDNQYAVRFTLGSDVSLSIKGDNKEIKEGVVDGYDPEGFYRVRWSDGTTTNGLTDIALEELVKVKECVCGSSKFINEGKHTVCDRCGRLIREGASLLADKKRPKGKRLIRSEAHPMSTADKPTITESEDDTFEINCYKCLATSTYNSSDIKKDSTTGKSYVKCKYPNCGNQLMIDDEKSLKEVIKEALKGYKMNEEVEDVSVFDKLRQNLDNEFWTRQSELVDDIEELGFNVEEINGEYLVVTHDSDEDNAYQIFIGGTSRTITLDFNRARLI